MKLSAELIRQCVSSLNPALELELSLRALKIPAIENLGATQDHYECFDFSDNEIVKVENFPALRRLQSLLLSNNRIRRIAFNLGRCLPRLETLVLTNNQIANLEDLDALLHLPTIQRLSLLQNPVCNRENYRLYVISMLPKLRHLDFQKVSPSERKRAEAQFGVQVQERRTAADASSGTGGDIVVAEQQGAQAESVPMPITIKQKEMLMSAIQNAKSHEEISRLEAMMKSGRVCEADIAKIVSAMDTRMDTI